MTPVLRYILPLLLSLSFNTVSFNTVSFAQTPESPSSEDVATEAPVPETPEYPWEICNETSFILRLAYAVAEGDKVMVRGWQKVNPGACYATSYQDDEAPRYLYAESLPLHLGGIREWKGNVALCVDEKDFESEAGDDCALSNFGIRQYLAVKPTEIRTSLIEPSDFGPKAETAGIQRLLRDAGYKITKIDGLPGRRTSRSLRDFKKVAELETDVEGDVLIDALSEAAQETAESVGVHLCNSSTATIWGAIAIRENGNWQSKGWWEIMQEECAQIYTRPLPGTEAHIYALQEHTDPENPKAILPDRRLRSVATTPAQFCIAESRFSALGREYCMESGYSAANFRPVPTEENGIKVTLNDADFAEVGAAGLRR